MRCEHRNRGDAVSTCVVAVRASKGGGPRCCHAASSTGTGRSSFEARAFLRKLQERARDARAPQDDGERFVLAETLTSFQGDGSRIFLVTNANLSHPVRMTDQGLCARNGGAYVPILRAPPSSSSAPRMLLIVSAQPVHAVIVLRVSHDGVDVI